MPHCFLGGITLSYLARIFGFWPFSVRRPDSVVSIGNFDRERSVLLSRPPPPYSSAHQDEGLALPHQPADPGKVVSTKVGMWPITSATKRIIASPARRVRRLAMFDHYPIHDLIENQQKRLGLRRSELARRCGFKNVEKGLRRIDGVCHGDLDSPGAKVVIDALPAVLGVDKNVVDEAIAATTKIIVGLWFELRVTNRMRRI
jgi:hypothetical protein